MISAVERKGRTIG